MAGDRQPLHEGGDGMKGLLDNEFDAGLLRQAFDCFPSGVMAFAPLVPYRSSFHNLAPTG
jgi:hypothetical protein